jgi:hypothetical protein
MSLSTSVSPWPRGFDDKGKTELNVSLSLSTTIWRLMGNEDKASSSDRFWSLVGVSVTTAQEADRAGTVLFVTTSRRIGRPLSFLSAGYRGKVAVYHPFSRQLLQDRQWVGSSRTPLVVEEEAHFKSYKWSWNEQKYGHEFRQGPKPRITAGEGQKQITVLLSDFLTTIHKLWKKWLWEQHWSWTLAGRVTTWEHHMPMPATLIMVWFEWMTIWDQ